MRQVGAICDLDHLTLQAWVNDALMTVFFLLVGVEIKPELVHGDLLTSARSRCRSWPPWAACCPGGRLRSVQRGWPGRRRLGHPHGHRHRIRRGRGDVAGPARALAAKIFLLTLAIADDVGAIVVIAVFYTGELSVGWLLVALAGLGAILAMRRADVQSLAPYLAVGAAIWLALLESGVHATLAGVALGLLTPAWPLRSPPGSRPRLAA